MSQRENAKSARKERASDKEKLKAEKKLAKARIRSERAARAKAKRERSGSSSFIKQLMEEKLKRQKKARAQAGEIASYIGYDAIYKDGIAQVEEGLFSQTIEFSDISYQSARRENQQNIFTVLSSLYNYFGADSCVQLTIGRGDRQEALLRGVRPRHGEVRQGVQPDPQRQDARRGLEPHATPLPHLHGGR